MKSFRLISYNLFKGRNWWSGRSALDSMALALQGHNPDFVFLQEFRGFDRNSKELHDYFQKKLGAPYGYYGKNFVSSESDHGNAIYSQVPLVEDGNLDLTISKLERRGLLCARVKPWGDGGDLFLFCTHLDLSEGNRRQQLEKLSQKIEQLLPDPETPFILAGDFNDWRHTADEFLHDRFGVNEAFRKKSGALAKSFPSFYPMLQLDRVYLRGLEVVEAQILTKNFRMLSDHLPLLVEVVRKHSK